MTAWVDIFYYSTEYLCGKQAVIPDTDFAYYARRATAKIKRYTGDIAEPIPDDAKLCCCEVAELLYQADAVTGGIISESNGSLSQSYESEDTRKAALQSKIKSAVYAYLADSGYLYRGM